MKMAEIKIAMLIALLIIPGVYAPPQSASGEKCSFSIP